MLRSNPASLASRQPLAVLFWDISGSCALLAAHPLETYCELVRSCQQAAARVVAAHGGFVARTMGDGMLAYFGFPRERHDDQERAVRAGLALPLSWTRDGVTIRSRAAIASGPVIVGAAIGSKAAREFPAFGEAPNLAARLLRVTPEHEVTVDEATRAALGERFAFEARDGLSLEGLPHVRRAWRVSSVAGAAWPAAANARAPRWQRAVTAIRRQA